MTEIADIIGRYVTLQLAPNGYKALCPFHEEKTPSFHVNVARGFWHCFGCGASGDVHKFVERRLGISFDEAVNIVAAIRLAKDIL